MNCHELEELGGGAKEDYQILERKLREVEKKIAKVIDSGKEVAYAILKNEVEE
jgi:hypothetical protein